MFTYRVPEECMDLGSKYWTVLRLCNAVIWTRESDVKKLAKVEGNPIDIQVSRYVIAAMLVDGKQKNTH